MRATLHKVELDLLHQIRETLLHIADLQSGSKLRNESKGLQYTSFNDPYAASAAVHWVHFNIAS